MKNKICRRIHDFTNDHNDAFYWTCGLITGASAVFVAMHKSPMNTLLSMTTDQAKAMISDPSYGMVYEFGKDKVILAIKD